MAALLNVPIVHQGASVRESKCHVVTVRLVSNKVRISQDVKYVPQANSMDKREAIVRRAHYFHMLQMIAQSNNK
jgi:hypothetical protein